MKKIQKLVTINIVCNITLIILVLGLFAYFFIKPVDLNKSQASLDNLIEDNKDGEKYVFLGDSITHAFNIDDLYESNVTFINSGENGNKVENVIERLQNSVYKYNPTKVFILIGINDLNKEENDINKLYDDIICLINKLENNTDAQLYLESIYPVNNSKEIVNNRTFFRNNKDVMEINRRLRDYCEKDNYVTYINVYDELIDEDGNLKNKYTTDGLHLTTLGYIKVVKVLSKYL